MTDKYIRVMDSLGRTLEIKQIADIAEAGADWIAYNDNGIVKVYYTGSGQVEITGADASTVLNQMFQRVQNGETVYIKGPMTFNFPVEIVDKTYTNVYFVGEFDAGSGLSDYMIKMYSTNSYQDTQYNKVYLGHLKGNGNCNGMLLQDAFHNDIWVGYIENVVKGITLKNSLSWTESNSIMTGEISATNYGIGFEVESGAANSFVNTQIIGTSFGVYQYGIYISPDANVSAGMFLNPHGWANADNTQLIHLEGTAYNLTIVSPYFEDVNSNYTGEALIYAAAGDFVLINPRIINVDYTVQNDGNVPFIMTDGQKLYFANQSPALYGGIKNYYDNTLIGWRTEGSSDKVLNLYAEGRTDTIYQWQEEGTWNTIFQIKGDGTVEGEKLKADVDLQIPTSQPSNPVAGSMYFDTSTGTLYVYDGSAWKSVTLS